jgi:hypothetical protein
LEFVKALRPGKLIFTVPQSGPVERPRLHFQMKLISFTGEAYKYNFPPEASLK